MTAKPPIYLDNHATTRTDLRVVEAMLPYFTEEYGNAASVVHRFGDLARGAVDNATQSIAQSLGADPAEIVFTSGATEGNNLALRGVAERNERRGRHLVSVRTEHRSVIDPLVRLTRRGWEVTWLEVEQHGSPRAGWLDPQRVADALREDTVLVSVMLANNEVGVIQPIEEIAAICRERRVLLHCDATQAVGKIPVNLRELGVDLASFSGHKIYGPKGVGGLFIRQGPPVIRLTPQITGGGQQRDLRSGTLNVPGIVGLAKAIALCCEELSTERRRLFDLRERLFAGLSRELEGIVLCGPRWENSAEVDPQLRLPGNLDVAFGDVEGESLLLAMPGLAVSSGAACSAHEPGPSHVLLALGMSADLARSSLRFGLGRFTTEAEIDTAIGIVTQAVRKLRKMSVR
jgi:cysteine desulfurase